ncbi:uncharacterized protein BDW43DRAFT_29033 [Aspergillus alliaceus]|uniref:uncharacterized protein n=1 Tax=Petromyces alliaceus TaxID=209559 RepID=UPI0012A6A9E6|nr:uncharacterized protein BDW43DRAFT_29033 [Aspergillus alliaceus]KAB8226897.1 hypothetical protein BDW43DRAFT_29033 [Aspergillus alliaceus]
MWVPIAVTGADLEFCRRNQRLLLSGHQLDIGCLPIFPFFGALIYLVGTICPCLLPHYRTQQVLRIPLVKGGSEMVRGPWCSTAAQLTR